MTKDPTENKDQVDKETLKDLEAKDAEDVKGGASGINDCKPLTENLASPGSTNVDLGA